MTDPLNQPSNDTEKSVQDNTTTTPNVPAVDYVEEESLNTTVSDDVKPVTVAERSTDTEQVDTNVVVEHVRKQNVTFTDDVMLPAGKPNGVTLPLPSDHSKEIRETLNNAPNMNYSAGEKTRAWGQDIIDSLDMYPGDDVYRNALEREGSEYRQEVNHSSGPLKGSQPMFKPKSNVELSGDAAIMRMQAHLGMGAMYRMPLWNTGIWITFKAPSESSLLELNRTLLSDKVELGRQSYGLSYSNTTSIFTERVVNFALEHIWNTTLKVENGFDLRTIISSHDCPSILLGMATAIYPDGFNHTRSCMADPSKCQHTIEERLNIPKTLLVDTQVFTNWQINHMANKSSGQMTLESVKRYQEEMVVSQKHRVKINEGKSNEVILTLRVPNVTEYVESGNRWISEMTVMVDRALNKGVDNDQRNEYIIQHGKATSLRQYSHWIDSIEYGGVTTVERETIEKLIGEMSASDDVRVEFMEKIAKFISSSTVTVVGIPSFKCPSCGKVNQSTQHHPHLTDAIPIDVNQVFFALLVQKIRRISER